MTQLSLLDPCARRHGGNAESVAAFAAGDKETDKARVLAYITAQGSHGATLDEIAEAFGVAPHRLSGRMTALKDWHAPKIIATGQHRPTRTGSKASVWVAR